MTNRCTYFAKQTEQQRLVFIPEAKRIAKFTILQKLSGGTK